MIEIDGSFGEGGGQCLRTSLTLSLATGETFRICNIRARRSKPGLRRQHLTAVQAAAAVGQGEVSGAALGSTELTFRPRSVVPGTFSFDVGSAGSTTLVLQTILPALMTAPSPSALHLEGGTHNPLAPPYDFVAKTYLPLFNRMGPVTTAKLDRYGFFPAAGGAITVTMAPTVTLSPFELLDRGPVLAKRATILLANLPRHIAEREAKVLVERLDLAPEAVCIEEPESAGPGNVVMLEIEYANVTEVFTEFGRIGLPAERVAANVIRDARNYLRTDAPVGEHLADQLLLPLALAGGGAFRTGPLSSHARTNIEVIKAFLDADISAQRETGGNTLVAVERRR